MDIDLLAKMVKDLLLLNDRVSLPGLGCFIAEMVPASFSDKGYTINPPYRRLYFRSQPNDGALLVKYYAESEGVAEGQARQILEGYVKELVEVLKEKKLIVFPELGRLRATKENNFFFVADEDADIYPEGFGLETVSLKSHKEEASAKLWETAVGDLADAVEKMTEVGEIELADGEIVEEAAVEQEEKEIEKEPEEDANTEIVEEQPKGDVTEQAEVGEPAVGTEKNEEQEPGKEEGNGQKEAVSGDVAEEPGGVVKVEDTGEEKVEGEEGEDERKPLTEEEKYALWKAKQEAEKNKKKKDRKEKSDKPKKKLTWLWVSLAVVFVLGLLVAAYFVMTSYCPDLLDTWLDSILYTPEELEIIEKI